MRRGVRWFILWVVAWVLGLSDVILGNSEANQVLIPSKVSSLAPLYGRSLKSLDVAPNSNPDTVLIAALDGTIHLVDKDFRRVIWSFTSGHPLYSSYQAPVNPDTEKENSSGSGSGYFIDCGEDWELYAHNGRFGKKLPWNIEDFIKETPVILEDGSTTLGSRKSTVFEVDALTGRLLRTYSLSDSPSSIVNNVEEALVSSKNVKDLVESGSPETVSVRPLKIIRTDYKLQSFAPNSNKIMWNLTVAEIGAALICQDDGESLSGSPYHLKNEPDYKTGDSFTMPLSCHSRVSVYRFRNHDMYRSLLKPQLHDSMQYPLPGPNQLQPSLPKTERLSEVRHEGLMLPSSDPGEHAARVLPQLPALDGNNLGVVSQHNRTTLHDDALNTWFLIILLWISDHWITLLILSILTYFAVKFCVGYWKEQGKQPGDANQETPPKKRRIRKSSKGNGSLEKMAQSVFPGSDSRSPGVGIDDETWMKLNKIVDHVDEGRRIGKLVVSNREIAKGSNGTIVFEGVYDGRPVAVKRLVQAHHDVALKEVQNLITSDQHPNIVRMFGVERDLDFVYLSLERCTCSLDDLIQIHSDAHQDIISPDVPESIYLAEYKVRLDSLKVTVHDVNLWKANGQPSPLLLKLMRDVVSGLVHLHELGIVHRDLKPQNVLIIKDRSLCAKLSDMGISKRLQGDMSSLGFRATGCGSSGWQAPEQLCHGRQTRAVDMFSLGCVLFFCITCGKHPFGDRLERDINIVKNKVDLFLVEFIPEAVDLFSHLLHPKPESRLKALEVLHHPFFWSPETRLSFLRDASDRVELEDREAGSNILRALESIASVALGGKWDEKVEPALLNDIGKYRRYKYDSVRDLLRVIRNKLNHYRELSKEVKQLLGQVPEGFNNYFAQRFPRLLIEVYQVICVHCREELCFQKYFKDDIY